MATYSKGYFSAPIQIPNAKSLTLSDADNSANVSIKPSDTTTSYQMELPSAIGSATQVLTINSVSGTDKAVLAWSSVAAGSVAADNISLGDAAVNLETSTGNITVNAYDNSNIAFQLNNTNALFLDSSSVQFSENAVPSINDGASLGTTSLMWSDLFLASAGVINFNNGNMTLTHSANDLTVAGGTLTSSGRVLVNDVTDATDTTDGSLQTDGGLSVVKDAVFGNDVKLLSDAAVLNFGADSDVSLTHVADTGLLLNTNMQLQFRDATEYINSSADGQLDINATDEIQLTSTRANVAGTLYAAGVVEVEGTTESTSTSTGALIVSGGVGIASNLHVGGNVFVTNATTLSSTLDVTGVTNLNDTTTSTSTTTGALIVDGGVGIAENVNVGGTLDVTGVTTLTDNVTASANLSVSKKFIVGVDTFTDLSSLDTTRTNLFNGSNAASVKHLDLNTASTLYGNVDAGVAGETLNLFYDNDSTGSANIDFTTNGLYAGSGLAQYLVFTNSGQSASLIYVGGKWRIINTGATVA